jgi:hypothetical protein
MMDVQRIVKRIAGLKPIPHVVNKIMGLPGTRTAAWPSLQRLYPSLLNARLSKRLRQLGVQPDTYLSIIEKDPEERCRFVDAISTNHTFFFR